MISHELSTIQQHNQVQEWLQSCPGYVEPDLEGLDSPFRVAYLPIHSWKGSKRHKPTRPSMQRQNLDAEMATKVREMVEHGLGVSAIAKELRVDTRRVHAIAKEFGIKLENKFSQRVEELKEAGRQYRAQYLEAVRPLAEAGLSIEAISKEVGCGQQVVSRLIKEHNISRGKRRHEVHHAIHDH